MIWREVFGIEAGGRLIDEQELGVLLQGAGNADTLALAAGERVGPLVDVLAQADAIEQLEGLVDVGLRKAAQERAPERHVAQPARQHVLHHGQALDQRELLEDHADAPARLAQTARATGR